MAELNANIILQGQAPQIQNPLDAASKAMTMRNLITDSQSKNLRLEQEKRADSDDLAVRNAYKNNMTTLPDGTPVVNQQGLMSELGQTAPTKVPEMQANLQKAQLDKLNQQHAIAKPLLFGITDQESYDAAKQKGAQLGLPSTDSWPKQFDPTFVRQMQMRSLSAEEQLAQANKQQEFAMQKQKNDIELAKLGQEQAHYSNDKRMKAVEDFNSGVEAARQSPDAQQELKDVLASKKISEIASQAPGGDLNKLNNQQTKLAMMEVVKMAGGSVPTEGELESMTPDGLAQKYGAALQKVTNKSQPANAGEFLQQGIDYANGIASIGKQSLADRSTRIADRLKPYLGADQHSAIKEQIANEFKGVGSKEKSPVMSFEEWKSKQAAAK